MPSTRKPSLGAIFLTIFLDLLGFGLVLPFLPREARDTFHSSAFLATLLSAVYSLMNFFFVPVWGRLSDRVGRRPVLLGSIAATALSNLGLGLGLAFGSSIGWLFLARAFAGIATANLATASAYITDVTSESARAKGMGLIGMAFGLGFILGPAVGGWLAKNEIGGRHGPRACFVAAALSVVNLVWVGVGLPESLPKELRGKATRRHWPFDFPAAKKTLADPMLARCVLVNFVAVTAFANLEQTCSLFNKDVFQMSDDQTGMFFALIGLAAAAVQGLLVRRLSGKVADSSMLRWGVGIQLVAFVGTSASPSVGKWMLYASAILLACGHGLAQPGIAAFVSKRAGSHERGAILGTNQSASSLARVMGPALSGALYGSFLGRRSPFVAAAIGMAIALIVARALREVSVRSSSVAA